MAVADMEYRAERKGKKKAYTRLKQIARLQGKRRPPPNPYPSAVKEIQAEERNYVRDRFHNPDIRKIGERMKAEKEEKQHERIDAGDFVGGEGSGGGFRSGGGGGGGSFGGRGGGGF